MREARWFTVYGLRFTVLLLLFLATPALAATTTDLSRIGIGVRAMGMGEAAVALDPDGSAVFSNPARLADIDALYATSLKTTLLGEIGILQAAVNFPSPWGSWAVSYIGSSLGESTPTDIGAGGVFVDKGTGKMTARNDVLSLSYARVLGGVTHVSPINFGTNLKIFQQSINGGAVSGGLGFGVGLDAGFLYKFSEMLNLGCSFQNLAGTGIGWGSQTTDTLPARVILGGGLKLIGEEGFWQFKGQTVDVALDYESSFSRAGVFHSGAEWRPYSQKYLSLRAGLNQEIGAGDNGSSVANNLSLGVGVFLNGFAFDYAYRENSALANFPVHYFSLSYDLSEQQVLAHRTEAVVRKRLVLQSGLGTEGAVKFINPEDKSVTHQGLLRLRADVISPKVEKVTISELKYSVADDLAQSPKRVLDSLTVNELNFTAKEGDQLSDSMIIAPGKHVIKLTAYDAKGKTIYVAARRVLRLMLFSDLPQGYFARDAAEQLATLGIISAFPGDIFKPNRPVTGGEVRLVIGRLGVGLLPPVAADQVELEVPRSAAPVYIGRLLNTLPADITKIMGARRDGYLTRGELAFILVQTEPGQSKVASLMDFENGYPVDDPRAFGR